MMNVCLLNRTIEIGEMRCGQPGVELVLLSSFWVIDRAFESASNLE
jgi:hypothetical protein